MKSYISREQDYALRITTYLADLPLGKTLPLKEITYNLYISRNFAGRIIGKLKERGILKTVQGKHGGVALARAPEKISIFEVLDAMGFKIKFNLCLAEEFHCELIDVCKFHNLFSQQEQLIHDNFKKMTIKDYRFHK